MRLEPSSRAYGIGVVTLLLGAVILTFVEFEPPRSVPAPQPHRATTPRRTVVVAKPSPPPHATVSAFVLEQQMTPRELLRRWDPTIAEASARFQVPQPWIRAVMVAESGGRTLAAE